MMTEEEYNERERMVEKVWASSKADKQNAKEGGEIIHTGIRSPCIVDPFTYHLSLHSILHLLPP